MGLFNFKFGGENEKSIEKTFWNTITSEEDLEKAILSSYGSKVVIFKHSTRCIISKTVLRNFESEVENGFSDVAFYFLDLIRYRPISNRIAEQFEVPHQSPQMIVLENGKAVANASHNAISAELIF